jgi:hypothetical protein
MLLQMRLEVHAFPLQLRVIRDLDYLLLWHNDFIQNILKILFRIIEWQ